MKKHLDSRPFFVYGLDTMNNIINFKIFNFLINSFGHRKSQKFIFFQTKIIYYI